MSFRNSRPELFYKKGVLKNFTKFTGEHLCQSLWRRCFPVKVKFLRTSFFIEHIWWLLLELGNYFQLLFKTFSRNFCVLDL